MEHFQPQRGFTITVNNTNRLPILNPIGDKRIGEASLLDFTVSATDPEGETLTFKATNLPNGATFNSLTKRFSWIPGYHQAGTYLVKFEVSEGSLSDSESVFILEPGDSKILTYFWSFSRGEHVIKIIADATDVISKGNEDNNTKKIIIHFR